ncbi:MAG: serine hydrolase [Thermoleophilia bacterium]
MRLPTGDGAIGLEGLRSDGSRVRSTPVSPVFGLPAAARPRVPLARLDATLQQRVATLVRGFPTIAAAYVQDLSTGAGAAWNARARFPAASTLKLAIAVEVLRSTTGPPTPGSSLDGLLRRMIVSSDNEAANALEVLVGGSTGGGSARVDALMRELGLLDSEMFGGYLIEEEQQLGLTPIPLRVEASPSFGRGKYTSAYDLARLISLVHQAADGRGQIATRLDGAVTTAEARYLLWLLLHTTDHGKLDLGTGSLPIARKAGWIDTARHDNGVVYWPGGAVVVTVLTFSPSGPGAAADRLAGEVARTALARVRALARAAR